MTKKFSMPPPVGRSLIFRIADRVGHAAEGDCKLNNEKGLAEEKYLVKR